jgi:hypothetical protein
LGLSYQGNRTHQCRNHDARAKVNTSVKMGPPFWYTRPPIAGRTANSTGLDIQCVGSSDGASSCLTDVRKRLSVEDRNECRVSEVSDSNELRRRLRLDEVELAPSARVAARLNIFCRNKGLISEPGGGPSGDAPSMVGERGCWCCCRLNTPAIQADISIGFGKTIVLRDCPQQVFALPELRSRVPSTPQW